MIEAETQRNMWSLSTLAGRQARSERRDVPALDARRGGPAERLAHALGGLHPAVLFLVVVLGGAAAIAVMSIGLGFLITRVVEHAWGTGAAGEGVNVWLAAHRTSSRTDASLLGSIAAGGVVLPITVAAVALVAAAFRM